ncbi:hypothetical protein OPIT5_21200 [Opitutaceae bacterium TAV5]|nr:hypothetical protein OPIT5_21200 [Opitutaceae bacterium TAV5]
MRRSTLAKAEAQTALMQRRQFGNAQAVNRDSPVHEQRDAGPMRQHTAFEFQRNPGLPNKPDFSKRQFVAKTLFVGTAKQTRPKGVMNIHCRVQQQCGQGIEFSLVRRERGIARRWRCDRQSPYPLFQRAHFKIDEQPQREASQPQVSQGLGHMNGQDFVDALQFDGEPAIDQQIKPVSAVQRRSLVKQRQRFLALVRNTESGQFQAQCLLAGCLINAGSQLPMHGDGRPDDDTRQLVVMVDIHEGILSREIQIINPSLFLCRPSLRPLPSSVVSKNHTAEIGSGRRDQSIGSPSGTFTTIDPPVFPPSAPTPLLCGANCIFKTARKA